MKVDIITPFKMQWLEGFKKVFPESRICKSAYQILQESKQADIKIYMWCNEDTVEVIRMYGDKFKIVVFIRRYEFYTDCIDKMDWSKVDAVIMVNDYLAKNFENRTGIKPHIIYNGILPENWKFKHHKHGKKIAMVGYINQKKNYPLAMQILAKLPKDYELHLAGGVQCEATMDYIDNIAKATKRVVTYNGQIDDIDFWLSDKNYLLSTAISEGNPNNVIEAMAKGIKPIVHNWPGSKEQFGNNVFNTVEEALEMMNPDSEYNSTEYRQIVEEKFGWENYRKVRTIVEGL